MSRINRVFTFPAVNGTVRRELVKQDRCPECGGELDTGWECNRCGFDASDDVHGGGAGPLFVLRPVRAS